ncbi:hypothetical protein C1924_09170 [Stenotrophomonas sp. ESTM1D_MKCIP4_1]|uniref:hypothetical protein n=1 Tax=Stenotrophomonas sp. ESTM1D_MKCIP4_1 TaxID=2072414 RepID=UPI000D5429E1|nr:hypothetical protein [Stenotrophomonas sp. ESTM1D_MKCIP4_1]AWH53336.1 hypothetical protein C1924_09170 [Stenotrophomonas sp. ESTM1D_MKCIP4_1]
MRVVSSLLAASLGILLAACQPQAAPIAASAADLPTPVPDPETPSRAGSESPESGAGTTAFRARGNEPGWLAVVDGNPPALRVEVDYGERRLQVAAPTAGADGWAGKAADGTEVKLTYVRTLCHDDMSGEAFEATAMLTVGARQYHGCGGNAAP